MSELEFEAYGPEGDASQHRSGEEIDALFAALPAPPKQSGRLVLIVRRHPDGRRERLDTTLLTPEEGVPGDGWNRRPPRDLDAQLAVMRIDIAEILAAGQDVTIAGDNLFVDLDVSAENLPTGTRLRAGAATFEVTPQPHNGCKKFNGRFGNDALRFVSDPATRNQNRRGLYFKVVLAGAVVAGDTLEVVSRP